MAQRNTPPQLPESTQQIVERYVRHEQSIKTIARSLGCNPNRIRAVLDAAGVSIRARGACARTHRRGRTRRWGSIY